MPNRTTRNLVQGLLVLSLLFLTMFTLAGTSTAQSPTGTPPPGTATSPTKPASVPKPKPPVDAKPVTGTADWDKAVADVAKSIGFTNYIYEAWQLPATATWDDTYKYYGDQMTQAGWTGQGITKDLAGGKIGAWVSDDGKTGLVMLFIASPDGTQAAYDLAIFGLTTPVPAAKSDWKPSTKTANTDQFAAQFAQMAGLGDYVYEMFDLPATAVWDDVFKYYNDQMAQAGWSGTGVSKDFPGGGLGLYIDPNTKTGLWLVYVASPDGTKPAGVVAIFGLSATQPSRPSAPAPPSDAVAVPSTPDLDKSVVTIASAVSLSNPTYDAWALPATSTADDIFKTMAARSAKRVGRIKARRGKTRRLASTLHGRATTESRRCSFSSYPARMAPNLPLRSRSLERHRRRAPHPRPVQALSPPPHSQP